MYRIPGITCVVNGAHDGLWLMIPYLLVVALTDCSRISKTSGHPSAGDLSFWWALASECPDNYGICE